jgi:hypothetical protein
MKPSRRTSTHGKIFDGTDHGVTAWKMTRTPSVHHLGKQRVAPGRLEPTIHRAPVGPNPRAQLRSAGLIY